MVGSAIRKKLLSINVGIKKENSNILTPSKKDLNLLDSVAVKNYFEINKPTIVILAAAKVGGIYANSRYPADFLIENLKIQTNVTRRRRVADTQPPERARAARAE